MLFHRQTETVAVGKTHFLVGGSHTGITQHTEVTSLNSHPVTTALGPLFASVIDACSRPPVLAVPTKLAPLKGSFTIDTGLR